MRTVVINCVSCFNVWLRALYTMQRKRILNQPNNQPPHINTRCRPERCPLAFVRNRIILLRVHGLRLVFRVYILRNYQLRNYSCTHAFTGVIFSRAAIFGKKLICERTAILLAFDVMNFRLHIVYSIPLQWRI